MSIEHDIGPALDASPSSVEPDWTHRFENGNISIQLTPKDPFEVYFEVQRDRITISLDHPTDSVVASNGGQPMPIHGLPNALHFHPAGSSIFSCKRDAKSSFAVISLSEGFRRSFLEEDYLPAGIDDAIFNIPSRSIPLLGDMLRNFCLSGHQGGQLMAESLGTMAVSEVVKSLSQRAAMESAFSPSRRETSLERVKDYVATHLADDISLTKLAGVAAMSTYHFSRSFRDYVGLSPHAFVLEQRLAKACRLLSGHGRIIDIALECGFSSQSHLTTAFRRKMGLTPAAYRKEQAS